MFEAFVIVLREGFEAFLIVAIIFAYLKKTGKRWLKPAVYSAIAAAIASSIYLGYLIRQGANQALWEGIFGLIATVLVVTLVFHMRRVAPYLTGRMHSRLDAMSNDRPRVSSFVGVFLFSTLMITREGMETALLLGQVRGSYFTGAILGLVAATLLAIGWARFGHLVNMKRFFQVTSTFLVLFALQIALYSFHELTEAGIFGTRSEDWHAATEIWSPEGLYGKWISPAIVTVCAMWLIISWISDRTRKLQPLPPATAK